MNEEKPAYEWFAADVTEHQMTVALDRDGYLHLKFRKPLTGMYWFDIIAWPGTLTIRGDMGTFVFARETDMLSFFRGQRVNPMYWAEKEQSGAPTKRYEPDDAKAYVLAVVNDPHGGLDKDERNRVLAQLHSEVFDDDAWQYGDGARTLLRDFAVAFELNPQPYEFHDTWEWDLTSWTPQYLWCCEALAWGIKQYDRSRLVAAANPDSAAGAEQ
jgi:hypothetical protein